MSILRISIALFVLTGTAACSEPEPESQAWQLEPMISAKQVVERFAQECIEQRHRSWAIRQEAAARKACGWFDNHHCVIMSEGMAEWTTPTSGGAATFSLAWDDIDDRDRKTPFNCSLDLPFSMRPKMAEILNLLNRFGRPPYSMKIIRIDKGEAPNFQAPRLEIYNSSGPENRRGFTIWFRRS